MPRTVTAIGPKDHGRPMRLEEFDVADIQEGYLYELSRGVVAVSDIPDLRHLVQVTAARRQFSAYDLAHPGRIYALATGSECKLLIGELESERHPDLAVYKTRPPRKRDIWARWIPEVVLEIVSPASLHRDYWEKREEYLLFGVTEYWILDADREVLLVLRRSGNEWTERTIRPPKIYRTRVLPGFEFDCALVFEAARAVG
jgi:hypothetical protein